MSRPLESYLLTANDMTCRTPIKDIVSVVYGHAYVRLVQDVLHVLLQLHELRQ